MSVSGYKPLAETDGFDSARTARTEDDAEEAPHENSGFSSDKQSVQTTDTTDPARGERKLRRIHEHGMVVKFKQLAEKDELDFYTCLSCSCGLKGFNDPKVRFYMYYRVPILIATQIMVPMCLLSYQAKRFEWGADDADVEFRLVGSCMYLYSVWNMYNNSSDECRTLYLSISRVHGLPIRMVVWALIGDVINTFCGFALVVTLFSVFCVSTDPYNLVINCVAINFLGTIDNDFADATLREEAFDDLVIILKQNVPVSKLKASNTASNTLEALDELEAVEGARSRCTLSDIFQDGLLLLLDLTRKLGTLVCGHMFCLVFLFARSVVIKYVLQLFGVHKGDFYGLREEP